MELELWQFAVLFAAAFFAPIYFPVPPPFVARSKSAQTIKNTPLKFSRIP